MNGTIRVTLTGDLPEPLQIGDELRFSGVLTVHSLSAELVDVSHSGRKSYLPGAPEAEAYANDVAIERA